MANSRPEAVSVQPQMSLASLWLLVPPMSAMGRNASRSTLLQG